MFETKWVQIGHEMTVSSEAFWCPEYNAKKPGSFEGMQ